MSTLAIAANGLRKSYGDKTVLDGIDLAVPEGTVFALLGPNGTGKTTAVKILSTLLITHCDAERSRPEDAATAAALRPDQPEGKNQAGRASAYLPMPLTSALLTAASSP